jgi:hypothetical protein
MAASRWFNKVINAIHNNDGTAYVRGDDVE